MSASEEDDDECYDLPCFSSAGRRRSHCCSFLPICPGFKGPRCSCCQSKEESVSDDFTQNKLKLSAGGQVGNANPAFSDSCTKF